MELWSNFGGKRLNLEQRGYRISNERVWKSVNPITIKVNFV